MKTEKPQRIVIYRLGSLGDTVVALPCFHKVAQTWPDAERIVLTNFPVSSKAAPLETILREGGLIHDAIAYPVGTRSVRKLWSLRRHLRSLEADVLVYLTPARVLQMLRLQEYRRGALDRGSSALPKSGNRRENRGADRRA